MPFQTAVCDPHVVFTPNHTLYLQLLTNYQELRVMGKAPKWQSDVFVVQHLDCCLFLFSFLIVCRFTACETGVRCEAGQKRVRLYNRLLNRTQFKDIFQNAHVLNTYNQSTVTAGYFYTVYLWGPHRINLRKRKKNL